MQTPEVISIIAGGWSAGQVDLAKLPGLIVAVNNASFYAPRIDVALSMDRKWANFRWPWLKEGGEAGKFETWLRRSAAANIHEEPPFLHRFVNDYRTAIFSDEPNVL